MIIVTGTKRSGTSMWMQILCEAGLPVFGEAFPRDWDATLRAANPDGFYESILRRGVYWRTNPHPKTGAYFFPEQVEHHVVKVFIPGVVRCDRAFIGRVIATLRHWREYEASLARLYAIEDEHRAETRPQTRPPLRMPAVLEWWAENYMLLRDVFTRRYPVHFQSYDSLLTRPHAVIRETLKWLGMGDPTLAATAVKPDNRTQRGAAGGSSVEPEVAAVFDLLYDTVHERRPVDAAFIATLNQTNVKLAPRIQEAQRAVALDARRRQDAHAKERGAAAAPDSPTW